MRIENAEDNHKQLAGSEHWRQKLYRRPDKHVQSWLTTRLEFVMPAKKHVACLLTNSLRHASCCNQLPEKKKINAENIKKSHSEEYR